MGSFLANVNVALAVAAALTGLAITWLSLRSWRAAGTRRLLWLTVAFAWLTLACWAYGWRVVTSPPTALDGPQLLLAASMLTFAFALGRHT